MSQPFSLPLLALAFLAPDAERLEKPPVRPACVSFQTQARAGMGYDHLVHIRNDCGQDATCTVSTNVNPAPTTLLVKARSAETVLTFRGSPAREFTAQVGCALASK